MRTNQADSGFFGANIPIAVGLLGTGYAAKLRAAALQADARSHLVAVVGHIPSKTEEFCQTYPAEALDSWINLINREDIQLVIISNINRDRGQIIRAALQAGKHVVAEYPLALDPAEAEDIIALATRQQLFLHVEHIELLGGLHQAIKKHLDKIGKIYYSRYVTISPQHPAPRKWSYHKELFGFPLSGALSRLHRFTDLFGQVATVNCQNQYWDDPASDFYTACLCNAQLRFTNGVLADIIYGKGETFWQSEQSFIIYGEEGKLIFTPEQGQLIKGESVEIIEVGSRRGLFAKDTAMVLDNLTTGKPLYITPSESLYTLKIADAARRSAETKQIIFLS